MTKIKTRLLRGLLLFLMFFLFSGIWIAYKYQKMSIEKESNTIALKQVQTNLLNLEKKLLKKEFKRLVSDMFIMKGFVEEDINKNNFINTEKRFINIILNRQVYDQIRYIDENGNEIVRVDLKEKKAIRYKNTDLQNKADRYYFTDTMAIKNGEVYISKLDLNIEHNEIEIPIKPMIRISTKVYDKAGNEKGIIITNYYANIMLNDFVDVAQNSEGNAYLLNSKSYWLSNTNNTEKEFAFMYDDKKEITFKNEYPVAYEEIFKNEKDFFETESDFFFATKVIPFKDIVAVDFAIPIENIILGDGNLMIVLHIEKKKIPGIYIGSVFQNIKTIFCKDIISFLVLFALSVLLSIFINLYDAHKRSLKFYAEMDQATNIFNRRAGLEKMSLLINKARTTKLNIGIIFVDVNGLKSVNDILGHQYGDQLIESAATIMKESIRQHDILFRYGGDEFIMCLEGLDSEGINNIWQRIKSKLDQINNNNELKFNISLSHGVSIIKGEDKNIDMNKYIEDADQKMYEEKIEIKKTAVIIKPPRSNL